mmetsp:Transcript_23502/g.50024  ORF Transcript_23502/g.50024 Transcript_23502/m.50024 type:complete len:281 (+) Transcript_23502:1706-2548(+)
MAEHDGVRDLHHGGLQVQGEEHALLLGLINLLVKECAEVLAIHEGGIEHLPGNQGKLLLQNGDNTVLGHKLNARDAILLDADGLLVGVEVPIAHGGDSGLGIRRPLTHGVRIPESVLLHGHRRAAVGITLAQHGVHGAAQDLAITGLDVFLLLVLGFLGVLRQSKALRLELRDALLELGDGCAHIGQLDNVGITVLRQLPQPSEGVLSFLILLEVVGEVRQNSARNRDILELYVHVCVVAEGLHHGEEGVRRQHGRLVGVGVHDGLLQINLDILGVHHVS